jgi:hypothetical protein
MALLCSCRSVVSRLAEHAYAVGAYRMYSYVRGSWESECGEYNGAAGSVGFGWGGSMDGWAQQNRCAQQRGTSGSTATSALVAARARNSTVRGLYVAVISVCPASRTSFGSGVGELLLEHLHQRP